jgi:hypothetical protein
LIADRYKLRAVDLDDLIDLFKRIRCNQQSLVGVRKLCVEFS